MSNKTKMDVSMDMTSRVLWAPALSGIYLAICRSSRNRVHQIVYLHWLNTLVTILVCIL